MSVLLSSVFLDHVTSSCEEALKEIQAQRVVERIWAKDHTVWKPSPEEITNRLGWLKSYEDFRDQWPAVEDFVAGVRAEGFRQVLLLGMGGSSLAPEIFRKILGVRAGYPDLSICDTTSPSVMAALAERAGREKTLFIVSTKSGGTVETLSAMKYFFQLTADQIGLPEAGKRFVAITDPGSKLDEIAGTYRFRQVFYGDPDIGGRYSALSVFGLVPAMLIGADVRTLLKWTTDRLPDAVGQGVQLGAMLGAAAGVGRNKATYLLSPALLPFGDWVEQLIAESTGKEGQGILPVVGEPPGLPEVYGPDRFFIRIAIQGEASWPGLADFKDAGHPVAELVLGGVEDLAELMYIWEMATAVAGSLMKVNPFDQPDVEAAKQFTRQVIARMQEAAAPAEEPAIRDHDIAVYGKTEAANATEALTRFLAPVAPGDYITLQAYLPPSDSLDHLLGEIRLLLRDRYRAATTIGYGPRFLHSTGQLHKGDDGRGFFIQLTADNPQDVAIPDEMTGGKTSLTFGVLQLAQARGDAQALESRRRRVVRFHFSGSVQQEIKKLFNSL